MNLRTPLLYLFFLFLHLTPYAQTQKNKPTAIHFTNKKQKIPTGGHLQGIQSYTQNNHEHFILTGSSGSYSYYLTAAPDSDIELTKIFDAPFRHAGGCQMADGKLFVGVEDNLAKDRSKVVMISPTDKTVQTIIERSGTYKRSTAGAVGAVKIGDHFLVAVGDWDSRNIDFYQSTPHGFDSVGTYHLPDTAAGGAYQSINLIADSKDKKVYLFGFCKEGNKHRCDVFELENFKLVPKSVTYYEPGEGCSFRYGTGVKQIDINTITIYTCQRKIKKRNTINAFRFSK